MKKLILSGLLLASAIIVNAQSIDTTATKSGRNGNNEIKINLLMSIAGIPELNYERIVADDQAVGLALLVGVNSDESDYKFGAIPYYRVYFGKKKASGFFIEANAAVLSLESNNYEYFDDLYFGTYVTSKPTTITRFGLGAAAGGKFLTKSGFIGEAYFGLGRIFGENNLEAYPRIGITIGKRF